MPNKTRLDSAPMVLALLLATCKNSSTTDISPVLTSEDDKVFYALGQDIAKNLQNLELQPKETELVKAGLADALGKRKSKVDVEELRPKLFELARHRQEAMANRERRKGEETLAKAAKQPGAEKLPSGIVFKTLRPGTGVRPTGTDTVKAHYEGRLADGSVFESSYKSKRPSEFPLSEVIECWSEGLKKMQVGGSAELVCPASLAYGEAGRPPTIPGGATLIFKIDLLESIAPKALPPVTR